MFYFDGTSGDFEQMYTATINGKETPFHARLHVRAGDHHPQLTLSIPKEPAGDLKAREHFRCAVSERFWAIGKESEQENGGWLSHTITINEPTSYFRWTASQVEQAVQHALEREGQRIAVNQLPPDAPRLQRYSLHSGGRNFTLHTTISDIDGVPHATFSVTPTGTRPKSLDPSGGILLPGEAEILYFIKSIAGDEHLLGKEVHSGAHPDGIFNRRTLAFPQLEPKDITHIDETIRAKFAQARATELPPLHADRYLGQTARHAAPSPSAPG